MKISLVNAHIPMSKLGYVPITVLANAEHALRNMGHDVIRIPYLNAKPKTDKVVCWGYRPKEAQRFQRMGKDVLILELGYIGNRREHISIGWNGLNNYAEFPEYPEDNGERFRAHGGVLKPWKEGGDYILILGQVKKDASLKGLDIEPWYKDMASQAAKVHGLPVYFRPHPESFRRRGYTELNGVPTMGGTLEESIEGAKFTIAFNSNSCLDSVMMGVPCVAGDKGTMAWDLCSKDVNNIIYPEREKLVYSLAWKQWTYDEIKEGSPLRKALEMK